MIKKTKKAKPTKRELEQQELINHQSNRLYTLEAENSKLRAQLQNRLDVSMLAERQKLANSIGQMTEAVSKAIMYLVAKETL